MSLYPRLHFYFLLLAPSLAFFRFVGGGFALGPGPNIAERVLQGLCV